jgi:RNA polymerase sigma-70 factor (ECF subfamily)
MAGEGAGRAAKRATRRNGGSPRPGRGPGVATTSVSSSQDLARSPSISTGRSLASPERFSSMYASLGSVAVASALSVLRSRPEPEEVAQEVFVDLWRRPEQFDEERGSLRVYVKVLARSRALDRARSNAVRYAALVRFTTLERPEPGDADPGAVRESAEPYLLSALDRLPRDQREALLLAYGKGFTARQIARAVGSPVGTAKSRLRLGLAKLRAMAEAEEGLSF